MTTSLPLLLLKNQFTVVTNECVTASFYCLGGVGRGRGTVSPDAAGEQRKTASRKIFYD